MSGDVREEQQTFLAPGPGTAPGPGRWPAVAVGVGLLTLAVGTMVFVQSSRRAPIAGPNVAVNPGARQAADLRQHNSPTLVRSPVQGRQLVVVNRIDNPLFSCAVHVSADAGRSWHERRLPFPAGQETPLRCYNPDAAFAADGTLHVSFVTLAGRGNTPAAVWVSSSRDRGQSFSEPVGVAGPLAFQVRLAVDPSEPRRIHLTWLQAAAVGNLLFPEAGNPITTVRSDDGGRTWGEPVKVSPPERLRVVAPVAAVDESGRMYVAYLDLGEDVLDYHGGHGGLGGDPFRGFWSLIVAISEDDGTTWTESEVDSRVVPSQRIVVFLPPTPSLVLDHQRRGVHVAFTDARLGDPDIWLWTSRDGGRTFGPPRRVNDTPVRDGSSQYLPRLALSGTGRLDVLYYDRREDPGDVLTRVSLQSSTDEGRTFGRRVRISDRAFDSRIGYGSERGLADLGSRLGLLSERGRALAVWADTRGGTIASGKQDLAAAWVEFPARGRATAVLGPLAMVLGAGGLVVLALALRCRVSRPPPPPPPPAG